MIEREQFRRAEDPWRHDISQSINLLKSQHSEIRTAVDHNTTITNEIKANTDEIIDFFKAGKGFFRAMGYVGSVAKWLGAVAAAVTAVWAAWTINK